MIMRCVDLDGRAMSHFTDRSSLFLISRCTCVWFLLLLQYVFGGLYGKSNRKNLSFSQKNRKFSPKLPIFSQMTIFKLKMFKYMHQPTPRVPLEHAYHEIPM